MMSSPSADDESTLPDTSLRAGDRAFTITRARGEDIPAIVDLLSDDPLGSQRESHSLEVYEQAFASIDADPHQFLATVRDEGGGVVGTMQLTLIPGLSRAGATRLQIEAVRIGRTARDVGLGTAMISWAHEFGRSRGATLAQLTTDKSRDDAHRFYTRLCYTASHEGMKRNL